MKLNKSSLRLYAVTDRAWLGKQKLSEQVDMALRAGATFLQLREKNLDKEAFLQEAGEIKKVADQYKIPFVINDHPEIALACGADGVHVGQQDMEAGNVRALIGENKILGVSVQTVSEALKAEKQGADYLGVGAVFSTSTKLDADKVSLAVLKEICAAVSIPVVAIGGIDSSNLPELAGKGLAGVAVVSAIFGADDILEATANLRRLADEMIGE
ncbi:thiamine phosphate synthase [Sinanaerobacter chloroacetimidivorans]|uniref:Thiamine-phosphate synthase n=1 Tax=Sinanaerobacter chloroacetimidivorans TaxID=2818044 RepID=A0A8J7VWG2_9FIRM|nr:thiamine phosphate synthase [Sinanaerobacter chloroacetimidivorans]MBR0596307.1 thiamine phosphate synthase [Sinanaerobacter chloroacetimidivorans]